MSDVLRGRRLAAACLALLLLRLVWGFALLRQAVERHGVLNTSMDELLHLRAGLLQAARPVFSLPPVDWQPPALTWLLGVALRFPSADPWWTAAGLSIVASAVGTVAAALAARRLAGGSPFAFVAGALLYGGSGLINSAGLVPALPHGLLLPAYALALWAAAEAASSPDRPRMLLATAALALLPLVRWEAAAYAALLAAALLTVPAPSPGVKGWLLLAPLPLALVLLAGGTEGLAGRSELLGRDTPPSELEVLRTLGPLAIWRYLGFLSPALAVAGTAALVWLAVRRPTPAARVALAAALGPVIVLGVLFTRGESGTAPWRLVGPFAVSLAVITAAVIAHLVESAPSRRWPAALAALLLVLGAEQLRFQARAPHSQAPMFRAAWMIREVGLEVVVEDSPGGRPEMIAALAGRTQVRTAAADVVSLEALLRAGGSAVVLLSPEAIEAAAPLRPVRVGPLAVVLPGRD